MKVSVPASKTRKLIQKLAAERILVLDGAMGTMIQALKLDEQDFRGARFDAWNREVRGNNDLLNLSRPQAVRDIHLAYYRAGATVPAWIAERFAGLDGDPATRKLIAAAVAAGQVIGLLDRGITSFHFYTMNRADLVYAICHLLGLRPAVAHAA